MTIHVHVACWNERQMMPWFLAHYAPVVDRIFCHDNGSTDGTQDLIQACSVCELLPFETGGELRDDLLLRLKNDCWKDRNADWVIVVDADELLYPTRLLRDALATYEAAGFAVPAITGYQMIAEEMPLYQPGQQIYDHVRLGALDPGYSKRSLFHARRVIDINYGIGSHVCQPVLREGRVLGQPDEALPPMYLLHFKYAQGLETVLRRHAELAQRASAINRAHGWGHHFWEPDTTRDGFNRIRSQARPLPQLDRRSDRCSTT